LIYRKILKVKTIGSKREGNLRPFISDVEKPQGLSYVVYEYNVDEGWCILELYGSDSPLMDHQIKPVDLDKIAKHDQVLEELKTHRLSPKVIGRFQFALEELDIDEIEKTVKHKKTGKVGKFIRKEKDRATEFVVLDE